jgi:hypothetical protein
VIVGRDAKAAEGRYIGAIPRFGNSVSDGELVPEGAEQVVVARVRGWQGRAVVARDRSAARRRQPCLRPSVGKTCQSREFRTQLI